jgi:hypothetical protein
MQIKQWLDLLDDQIFDLQENQFRKTILIAKQILEHVLAHDDVVGDCEALEAVAQAVPIGLQRSSRFVDLLDIVLFRADRRCSDRLSLLLDLYLLAVRTSEASTPSHHVDQTRSISALVTGSVQSYICASMMNIIPPVTCWSLDVLSDCVRHWLHRNLFCMS